MSRRNRGGALIVKPADEHLAKALLETQPIAEDSGGGPWFLKDTGEPVKPFIALKPGESLPPLPDGDDEPDDHLTEAVSMHSMFEEVARRVLAEDASRAARRMRGIGDHERAKTLEVLAQVARGE